MMYLRIKLYSIQLILLAVEDFLRIGLLLLRILIGNMPIIIYLMQLLIFVTKQMCRLPLMVMTRLLVAMYLHLLMRHIKNSIVIKSRVGLSTPTLNQIYTNLVDRFQ